MTTNDYLKKNVEAELTLSSDIVSLEWQSAIVAVQNISCGAPDFFFFFSLPLEYPGLN